MFICFFSLSSSMTGNLYEQAKEISVMRSIGFTKYIIMKLFVYEAFILVISSSFSGVVIGTWVGWGITVQRSMFVGMPTPLTFPKNEFIFILSASVICAFLSTYGPSKNLMARSIPDIARFNWKNKMPIYCNFYLQHGNTKVITLRTCIYEFLSNVFS